VTGSRGKVIVTEILWILSRVELLDLMDILLVGLTFFGLLLLMRGTQAVSLLRGVIVLLLSAFLVSQILRLTAFNWLIRSIVPALLVVIPIVLQPELRRAFERLGRPAGLVLWTGRDVATERTLEAIAVAARWLSERRHGALIVIERETGLQEYVDRGVSMDATVTPELLLTIFYPNTALHDGAAIVRGDRLSAAACVLPLTDNTLVDSRLGTRHRAGLGMSEQTDAVTVIVSEETGTISLAYNGRMVRHLDERRLKKILRVLCQPRFPSNGLTQWFTRHERRIEESSGRESARA
jgi:diadenylate cyclase